MKHTRYIFLIAIVFGISAFTAKETSYKIDTKKSKITWVGKKMTGSHTGTIDLAEGTITAKDKKFTGGSFVMDMTSIKDVDANQRLENHLKSDDFFSSEKFPKSAFTIGSIEATNGDQYLVKGNLTIKGITNEIQFPATIKISGEQLTATAKIIVDRTKFDIKFRSGNFFENLGDKAIDDNFELAVELVGAANTSL